MGGQAGAPKLLKARIASSDSIDPVEEIIGHELDVSIAKDSRRRPLDNAVFDGPNLAHHRRKSRNEFILPNDTSSDGGTHDVNDEMLAKEYRRGLRVRGGHRIVCNDLSIIIGEGDDIVE